MFVEALQLYSLRFDVRALPLLIMILPTYKLSIRYWNRAICYLGVPSLVKILTLAPNLLSLKLFRKSSSEETEKQQRIGAGE